MNENMVARLITSIGIIVFEMLLFLTIFVFNNSDFAKGILVTIFVLLTLVCLFANVLVDLD